MSANTSNAIEADPFWKEVVAIMTGGKKLRSDSYLANLTGEDLEQLRLCLLLPGSLEKQLGSAPKWRGGPRDGQPPDISTLSRIGQALREAELMRELERQELLKTATEQRCGQLGLNSQLTNAVMQIVGEEAIKQRAAGVVDDFALNAARVLLQREGMAAKAELEKLKLEIARQAETRQQEQLNLMREKFQIECCETFLAWFKDDKARQIAESSSSNADKIAELRREYFKDVDALQQSGQVKLPE